MMNLMDRPTYDNGRLTTCQVVPVPIGTILCGLATRLLQLFAHHDHDILFVSCLCVWCYAFEVVEADSLLNMWARRCVCCYHLRVMFLECVVTTSTYDELRAVFKHFSLYDGNMRTGSD